MIELAKHIEILLLDNECVIVPELGGFITHYQPAHYEESEGLFVPPVRTVGFNSQLTMNDGLLIQSYMQAYHTDFSDAARIISEKVKWLKENLHKEGFAELEGIGTLHYTIYGTYEFRPNENGIISPALYALDSFSIYPLALLPETEETNEKAFEVKPLHDLEESPRRFRLNPQWLGNAVAVAVAAILFFVLSVPVENTHVDKGMYASLGTDCLFDAIRNQSVATTLPAETMAEIPVEEAQQQKKVEVAPVVVKVEKVEKVEKIETEKVAKVEKTEKVEKVAKAEPVAKAKETPAPAPQKVAKAEKPKATTPKQATTSSKKYHVIVASLTTAQDARQTLQNYKKQGHQDASIIESKGRFRISLCSYADKSVAYNKLNDLKQNDSFKNAWMLTSN